VSRKAGKTRKQTPTRQQQQDAAARRRAPAAGPAGRQPAVVSGDEGAGGSAAAAASDAATPASAVRHYLDVSAVRIQEWLARTPGLRSRRGGSVLLSEVTGRDAWPDERLPSGMAWNDEAGDLDGVVALVVQDTVADLPACLSAAARDVAAALRRTMPHCAIQAVTGSGDSYASAWHEMQRARRDGDFVVDVPSAPVEAVLAKPCDDCRAAPAERHGIEIAERAEPEDLCGECADRIKAAGGTKGDRPSRSPRPQRRLKAALSAAGMRVIEFPGEFRELAKSGTRDGDDAATQLGLVYADGNRVGAFLTEAARCARERGTPAKAEIVPALDGAAVAALADAVVTCFPGRSLLPVLVHVAGGDDLMVSVPAGDAWPFVCALLAAFGQRIDRAAGGWPEPVRDALPSMSAGLVFHHQSAPFSDVVRLAKARLDEAKKATRGRAASVAFLDLTADGGQAPACRTALTLTELSTDADRLAQIAVIPHSHLQTLVALHRRSAEDALEAGSGGRGETPAQTLARRVTDLGYQPLLDAIAGPGAGGDDARTALASPAKRDELRRVLDLARWWPPPTTPAATGTAHPRVGEGVPV